MERKPFVDSYSMSCEVYIHWDTMCVSGQHLFSHLPALGILLTAQHEVGEDVNRRCSLPVQRLVPEAYKGHMMYTHCTEYSSSDVCSYCTMVLWSAQD